VELFFAEAVGELRIEPGVERADGEPLTGVVFLAETFDDGALDDEHVRGCSRHDARRARRGARLRLRLLTRLRLLLLTGLRLSLLASLRLALLPAGLLLSALLTRAL